MPRHAHSDLKGCPSPIGRGNSLTVVLTGLQPPPGAYPDFTQADMTRRSPTACFATAPSPQLSCRAEKEPWDRYLDPMTAMYCSVIGWRQVQITESASLPRSLWTPRPPPPHTSLSPVRAQDMALGTGCATQPLASLYGTPPPPCPRGTHLTPAVCAVDCGAGPARKAG